MEKRNKKINYFIFIFFAIFGVVALILFNIKTGYSTITGSFDSSMNLVVSETGTGVWSINSNSFNGSVTASSSTSCGKTTYSASTTTLTLKYNGDLKGNASLSFSYELNSGNVSIDNTNISQVENPYQKELQKNDTIVISMTSNNKNDTATSFNCSQISIATEQLITTYFDVPQNGQYTITSDAGCNITMTPASQSSGHFEQLATIPYHIVASSYSGAENYSLCEWRKDGKFFSDKYDETFYNTSNNTHLSAFFTLQNSAIFSVNNVRYYNLKDANNAAKSGSVKTIILLNDGSIYPLANDEYYEISAGVTLLVPCDSSNSENIPNPSPINDLISDGGEGFVQPYAYRILTLKSDVKINCYGTIDVTCDKICAQRASGLSGCPRGAYGAIIMENGSLIELQNNSILYCYGFIYENNGNGGQIIANYGSKVYECFQMAGWRGGTQTKNINNYSVDPKVFPFNQYYFQNIEVSLTIKYGANEYVVGALSAQIFLDIEVEVAVVQLIGANGMFVLNNGSSLTKVFSPKEDRLFINVNGDVTLSSINISAAGTSINSTKYVLPIANNMEISLNSSSLTTNQHLAFLAGSKVYVSSDSSILISNSKYVYVYDSTEWKGYAKNGYKINPLNYSPSSSWVKRSTTITLPDAEIDVNGEIQVSSGSGFYTTESGANIWSSKKTGVVKFNGGSGNQTFTYQPLNADNCSNYDSIPITNAKLKHGPNYANISSNPYYLTSGHSEAFDVSYNFDEDKWGESEHQSQTFKITFYDPYTKNTFYIEREEGKQVDKMPTSEEAYSAPNNFNYNGFTIKKWVSGTDYEYDPGQLNVSDLPDSDITLTAFYGGWRPKTSSETTGEYVLYEKNNFELAKGLYKVQSFDKTKESIYVFNSNGLWVSSGNPYKFFYDNNLYEGGDNQYYYVNNGLVVENPGLIYIESEEGNYFSYFGINNFAYKNGIYYINNNSNKNFKSGYYMVDNQGKIIIPDAPNTVTNDLARDQLNNICYDYGLFKLNGYLYYADTQGKIVKNCTYYVTRTNNYKYQFTGEEQVTISEGLYYFDSNGHMYSQDMREITGGITNA